MIIKKKPSVRKEAGFRSCFSLRWSFRVCISQAVSDFFYQIGKCFHSFTIVRQKCFNKSKAAFSDNISRLLLEKADRLRLRQKPDRAPPNRTGNRTRPVFA